MDTGVRAPGAASRAKSPETAGANTVTAIVQDRYGPAPEDVLRLAEIDRPTIVLHGTEDRTVAPENGSILAERIPNAELHLLEGAGHLYHSERAEEADQAVLDFIRRHRG